MCIYHERQQCMVLIEYLTAKIGTDWYQQTNKQKKLSVYKQQFINLIYIVGRFLFSRVRARDQYLFSK